MPAVYCVYVTGFNSRMLACIIYNVQNVRVKLQKQIDRKAEREVNTVILILFVGDGTLICELCALRL